MIAEGERSLDRRDIAVCLSGGGLRSACFAAGVLKGIAELDLLQRLVLVTSTSGGSITHAVVALTSAQLADNRADDQTRKRLIVATLDALCRRLADKGVSPYHPLIRNSAFFACVMVAFALYDDGLREIVAVNPVASGGLLLFVLIYVIALTYFPEDDISRIASRRLSGFLFGQRSADYSPSLDDLIESPIDHVFVTTDLATFEPVYLSPHGIGSKDQLTNDYFKSMPLAEVVLDTMRFPGYLPPRSLRHPRLPLGDGGIVDNHATSCLLLPKNSTRVRVVIVACADAGIDTRLRWGPLQRIRTLTATMFNIHAVLSRQYLIALKLANPAVTIISVSLPRASYRRTSLARIGRSAKEIYELGRRTAVEELEDATWV